MTSATPAYTFEDVDFGLNANPQKWRAKDITISKTANRLDQDQMGSVEVDIRRGTLIREWSMTLDERQNSGDFAELESWANGSDTNDIVITKGTATLTLSNAKCFSFENTHGSGATSQITLSGTTTALSES